MTVSTAGFSYTFWCDHCLKHSTAPVPSASGEAVRACEHCGVPTVIVRCNVCEKQAELARLEEGQRFWVCPTCKEARGISAELARRFQTNARYAASRPTPWTESRYAERINNNLMKAALVGIVAVALLIFFGQRVEPVPLTAGRAWSTHPAESYLTYVERDGSETSLKTAITTAPLIISMDAQFENKEITAIEWLDDQNLLIVLDRDRIVTHNLATQSDRTFLPRAGNGTQRYQNVIDLDTCHEDNTVVLLSNGAGDFGWIRTVSSSNSRETSASSGYIKVACAGSDDTVLGVNSQLRRDPVLYRIQPRSEQELRRPYIDGTPTAIIDVSWFDAETVVFLARDGQERLQLFLYRPNLGTYDPIGTSFQGEVNSIEISPHGDMVAMSADLNRNNFDLYLVSITDGERTQLTETSVDELYPAWRP